MNDSIYRWPHVSKQLQTFGSELKEIQLPALGKEEEEGMWCRI